MLDPASYSLQPTIIAHFHVACCSMCHDFMKSSPFVTFSQCFGVFPMSGTFLATIHPLFLSIRSLETIPLSPYTQLMLTQNSTKCVLHKFFILYWGLPLDSSRPSTQLLKIPIGTVLVLSLTSILLTKIRSHELLMS